MHNPAKSDRWNWWLSLFAAAGAFIAVSGLVGYSSDGDILYLLLVFPAVTLLTLLFLAYYAIRRRFRRLLSVVVMFVVYCAASWASLRHCESIRNTIRWALESKRYKAEVLAQPLPLNGELRHVEWDDSGWAGSYNQVYLVHDPQDSLASAARSGAAGHFAGIPCAVPRVQRLQGQWYSVALYTNTGWSECN